MTRRLGRWLTGRAALGTLTVSLVAVLVVAVAGQFLGWWPGVFDLLRGTAVGPPGGYTCLPSCSETDGLFLALPSEGQHGFGGGSLVVWVTVPQGDDSFQLGVFDGDSGKDDGGNLVGGRGGNWDGTTAETTYTLYADPMKDGSGQVVVGQWLGNQQPPNNAWFDILVDNRLEARSPSGVHIYRLEVTQPPQPVGLNRFKLRSTGYLSAGQAEISGASLSLVGGAQTVNDVPILFPQFQGDYFRPGPSRYAGDWQFYLFVPDEAVTLEIWDGDFDRGTSSTDANDTDDPNTTGRPLWAGPATVDERAGGRGAPADDVGQPILQVEPPIRYEIVDPEGNPVHVNEDPSGAQEWEKFSISTDSAVDADLFVDRIQPGFYNVHIEGLDGGNVIWIRTNYEIMSVPSPLACDASCPSTLGYWQRNVAGVFGYQEGLTQETTESVQSALYLTAQYSPLFRSGIDVNAPRSIADAVPLSAEEAHMILQRDTKSYPGGRDAANSMLARALQQNLANWLNLMSGKICRDTYVTLTVAGGPFEGAVADALWEVQSLVFDGGDLERAKDIADQINNGLRGEDAETSTCDDYVRSIPPDMQKPSSLTLPQAPQDPVLLVSETLRSESLPITCAAPRVNTYSVENPTDDPFYGLKFEYQAGAEVKDSDYDEFQFTLKSGEAASMTSVQMGVQAGENMGLATLEGCQFDGPLPCGEPTMDDSGLFAFHFMGAQDHDDGTMTLVFRVQNYAGSGLSYATIGLPAGVAPSSPEEVYESEVCP